MDRAEDAQWRQLHRPVLAFWEAKGTVGKPWDVLASWRAESAERVSHKALACGDLLTEEAHDAMLAEFSASVRE